MYKQNAVVTLGDILKSEADPNSRVTVEAPKGTKIGQLFDIPNLKHGVSQAIALSDEENGKVLIQTRNYCIDLQKLPASYFLDRYPTNEYATTGTQLNQVGAQWGIIYINEPYDDSIEEKDESEEPKTRVFSAEIITDQSEIDQPEVEPSEVEQSEQKGEK